ncbi:MAG: DUF5333 domain-containing protein [Rhodobacteraceae bacterium]|nr:DUF5333 domain-containing protein [Paracoccaceae bacterium]
MSMGARHKGQEPPKSRASLRFVRGLVAVALFGGGLSVASAASATSNATSSPLLPLRQNAAINDRLFAAGIVRRLHKRCPELTYHRLRSALYLSDTYKLAEEQGYARAAIEAYLDDSTHEAQLYEQVDRWLAARGAHRGDAASYCAVGMAEIANKSLIGSFLREN